MLQMPRNCSKLVAIHLYNEHVGFYHFRRSEKGFPKSTVTIKFVGLHPLISLFALLSVASFDISSSVTKSRVSKSESDLIHSYQG